MAPMAPGIYLRTTGDDFGPTFDDDSPPPGGVLFGFTPPDDPTEGLTPGQKKRRVRDLNIAFAHERMGLSYRAIGRMFGVRHSRVAAIIKEFRDKYEKP